MRGCAKGVASAAESKTLPLSLKASRGEVLISCLDFRLLKNGTARSRSRN